MFPVIVSLAVHDGAFDAASLTSARPVFQMKNRGPVMCTPFFWKKEWLKPPVFRRLDNAMEPLQYHRLRDNMARQSLNTTVRGLLSQKPGVEEPQTQLMVCLFHALEMLIQTNA